MCWHLILGCSPPLACSSWESLLTPPRPWIGQAGAENVCMDGILTHFKHGNIFKAVCFKMESILATLFIERNWHKREEFRAFRRFPAVGADTPKYNGQSEFERASHPAIFMLCCLSSGRTISPALAVSRSVCSLVCCALRLGSRSASDPGCRRWLDHGWTNVLVWNVKFLSPQGFLPLVPPPPPLCALPTRAGADGGIAGLDQEVAHLSSMLLSWYLCGYHTGYYMVRNPHPLPWIFQPH